MHWLVVGLVVVLVLLALAYVYVPDVNSYLSGFVSSTEMVSPYVKFMSIGTSLG